MKLTPEMLDAMASDLDCRALRMVSDGSSIELSEVYDKTRANASGLRLAALALRWADAERLSPPCAWPTEGSAEARRAYLALMDACREASRGKTMEKE